MSLGSSRSLYLEPLLWPCAPIDWCGLGGVEGLGVPYCSCLYAVTWACGLLSFVVYLMWESSPTLGQYRSRPPKVRPDSVGMVLMVKFREYHLAKPVTICMTGARSGNSYKVRFGLFLRRLSSQDQCTNCMSKLNLDLRIVWAVLVLGGRIQEILCRSCGLEIGLRQGECGGILGWCIHFWCVISLCMLLIWPMTGENIARQKN